MTDDAEEKHEGVEILDGAVSTTSSAVTHELDKRAHRLNTAMVDTAAASSDRAAGADGGGGRQSTGGGGRAGNNGTMTSGTSAAPNAGAEDLGSSRPHGVPAAVTGTDGTAAAQDVAMTEPAEAQREGTTQAFEEERRNNNKAPQARATTTTQAVPIIHVGRHDEADDDVSSLQHTEVEERHEAKQRTGGVSSSRYANNGAHSRSYVREQSREPAIEEGTGISYYDDDDDEDVEEYEVDEEQVKALQRRNMLIIVMLLVFLGLVVAIGAGVGLAVKNNDVPEDPAKGTAEQGPPPAVDDNDNFGIGGPDNHNASYANLTSVAPSQAPTDIKPCIPVEIGIIFDEYTDETGWMLVRGNYFPEDYEKNDVVWKSKFYKPQEYAKRADTLEKCFPEGYYTFVFTDEAGDGLCCYHGEGKYVLTAGRDGRVIKIGGAMDSEYESVVFQLPYEEPEPVDEDGDGRDDRLGLVMPYDSSNYTEGVDCENFRLVILTDEYGVETTWELYEGNDKSGTLVADGGPYGSDRTYVVDECLASPREYALYVYDWDRRGLCCETGEGWFKVTSGDILIVDSRRGGEFDGEVNITRFVLPADGSAVLAEPTPAPIVLSTGSPVTKSPMK